MNVGIIIFIISVIITGISAMRDKSHEDRQNQKPLPKSPHKNQPKKGAFFEQLEKTFKEISDELNGEPEKKQRKDFERSLPPLNKEVKEDKPLEHDKSAYPKPDPTPYKDENNKPQPVASTTRDDNTERLRKELETTLSRDLINVRNEKDKEKEKQLQMIEKKAQDIIQDEYLSERTKRYRLKQLLNSQNVERNMTHSTFKYDNDEVINGLIWSEILSKPKQL